MIRKFNFTGRKRIEREYFSIRVEKNKKMFEVSLENLNKFKEEYNITQESKIYVEAYNRSSELKQFEFTPPSQNFSLDEFDDIDTIKFRIMVVDKENKIIASAERIKPEVGEKRKSILEVRFINLGSRIWKLEFESGEEGGPLLFINKNIPGIQNLARNDPSFIIYVYPSVLKEILYYMCFNDNLNIEEPEEEWHKDWMKFIRLIYPPAIEEAKRLDWNDKDADRKKKLEWIDKIVDEFCKKREREWREFIGKLRGDKE